MTTPLSRTEVRWLALFALLYLTTAFLGRQWRPQLPFAVTGDEPHYLVMLNSVIEDGDLDLGNNYESARLGGFDAGKEAAGRPLDHHTVRWEGNRRIGWGDVYSVDLKTWKPDGSGRPAPQLLPGHERELNGVVERPTHPPGLAWLLAPFVWPFRGTRYVEPAAILVITFGMIAALLLFHALIRLWVPDTRSALLVTAATFLGTPLWHYSRKMFAEGPLTLCAVGAFYFVLARYRPLLAGVFLGAGTQMKPPFLLLAIPLAAGMAFKRDIRGVLMLAIPCALATAVTLASNWIMFGSPFRSPQSFIFGNPIVGAWGLLAGPSHGFLAFAPIGAFALAGWPAFWRLRPQAARVLAAGIGLYFGLMSLWITWDGGWCYGPRLILPIIPFAMMGLIGIADSATWVKRSAYAVGIISIIVNCIAAGGWSVTARGGENPFVTLVHSIR